MDDDKCLFLVSPFKSDTHIPIFYEIEHSFMIGFLIGYKIVDDGILKCTYARSPLNKLNTEKERTF